MIIPPHRVEVITLFKFITNYIFNQKHTTMDVSKIFDLIDRIPLPKVNPSFMDEGQFWDLISRSLQNSKNQDEQEQYLIAELTKLPDKEIVGFHQKREHLSSKVYTSEMWCAAFLCNALGCSEDGFEYFVQWLISRGRDVFYDVLHSPDNMINYLIEGKYFYDFECFGYVAKDAYENKTGNDFYIRREKESYTFRRERIKCNWDIDDPESIKAICPRLFKKFSWKLSTSFKKFIGFS